MGPSMLQTRGPGYPRVRDHVVDLPWHAAFPLDVPVGWSDPSDVNMVHALLLLGGIPLLLFIGDHASPSTCPR